MNYELALQLKEAGFKQIWIRHDYYTDEGMIFRAGTSRPLIGTEVSIPTLSELIDACGDKFGDITKRSDHWTAGNYHCDEEEMGSFPEEAVARLWLKLNKKI